MFTHFWIDFVTLLATMNPIAVIPAYITLTDGLAPAARTRVLRRAILVSAAILLVFLIVGEIFLNALGVTLDAFRIESIPSGLSLRAQQSTLTNRPSVEIASSLRCS